LQVRKCINLAHCGNPISSVGPYKTIETQRDISVAVAIAGVVAVAADVAAAAAAAT